MKIYNNACVCVYNFRTVSETTALVQIQLCMLSNALDSSRKKQKKPIRLCYLSKLKALVFVVCAAADCSSDLVSSEQHKSGTITSPNYGKAAGYPSNLVCRYRFYGNSRERVRIVFNDFDLRYPDGDASNPHQ